MLGKKGVAGLDDEARALDSVEKAAGEVDWWLVGGGEVSHEAELHGEVNGADFSVHWTHNVVVDVEKANLCDALGDSHKVMLASGLGKRRSKATSSTKGESGESRGKRICVDYRDHTDNEGTVDTAKVVIFHGVCAVEKDATDGHMVVGNADEDNGCTTVNEPRFYRPAC
ncbi:hypothetical protein AXG93_1275s1120 [Marchantia polymorpha subsp. ruderalis]|uniref:Uncharacterized protein n=1 Tax=Marchantia polymorpha subsp. ruderalis TaxID=1480154 RepID=A0A176VN22_MARPO|nr:hypothetical protein AXG93_1275s1120 [Marchantia polymorpha subsp. ruderalis]